MKPIIWKGCYDGGWKGIIVPDAFAHPAKFSRALIQRILDHGLARGYWKRGEVIGDPFGGVGLGGIEAAYRGLRWVGNELEPKFVDLAGRNFELHRSHWEKLGLPLPVISQGDSREFDVIVRVVNGIVTSPPFTQDQPCQSQSQLRGNIQGRAKRDQSMVRAGNIQALRFGDVAGVITSPPYSDIAAGAGGLNTKPAKRNGQQSGRKADSASQEADQRYGATDGQISQCKPGQLSAVISSPPFRDARSDTTKSTRTRGGGVCAERHHTTQAGAGYGAEDGQIDNLTTGDVDAVVTSPPWEKNVEGGRAAGKFKGDAVLLAKRGKGASDAAVLAQAVRDQKKTLGDSDGQIGQTTGETYWEAMALVYAACFRSIKPDGYIAAVVKDYVKNKQRVPLCDDTLRLLEHVGFVAVERIHAMLVEETTHEQLFGDPHTTKRERKSFFRRLAEKKGSPRIDYEEVLICRRPAEA